MLTPRKGMSRLWSWSPSNKIQLAHQKDFQGLCARQRYSTCPDKHDLCCAGLVCKQMTVTFGKMPDALVRHQIQPCAHPQYASIPVLSTTLHYLDVCLVIFVTHKSMMPIPTPTVWTPPWYATIHNSLCVHAVSVLLTTL